LKSQFRYKLTITDRTTNDNRDLIIVAISALPSNENHKNALKHILGKRLCMLGGRNS